MEFSEKRHPIQVAVRRTGLSAEVLRVWEKRYGAIHPGRTPSGRRLYSDGDIETLRLLREATELGRRIGLVAALSQEELRILVEEDRAAAAPQGREPESATDALATGKLLEAALDAVIEFDAGRLEALLRRAMVRLGSAAFTDDLVSPLVTRIGEFWAEGRLHIYHEHLATAVIRRLVEELFATPALAGAPTLIVSAPSGQKHEIGALLATAAAIGHGWRGLYLGVDLPATEIASACVKGQADAVALSLIFPDSDPALADELHVLREHLPQETPIVVGGAASRSYQATLLQIGARMAPDLRALRSVLTEFETDRSLGARRQA